MSRAVRTAVAVAGVAGAAGLAQRRIWRPTPAGPGTGAPPVPRVGVERVPVVGALARFANVIGRPVELVDRCRAQVGPVFTLRVPGLFDLVYLCDDEGYDLVTRGSAEDLTFGAVLANVPVVGIGYPRAGDDVSTLQDLLVATRRLLAERMPAAARAHGPQRVAAAVGALPEGDHDLTATIVPLLLAESCRAVAGSDLWSRYGADLAGPLLDVARGIDIPRATLSVLPTRRATREMRASRRIHQVVTQMVAENDRGDPVDLVAAVRAAEVAGRPIHERDVPWVLMYVLWNAATYPSTYGFWSVLDVLERPGLAEQLRTLPPEAARALAVRCVQETVRVHPLSSLPRYVERDMVWSHGGRRWAIPAGARVAAFPVERFREAGPYDPAGEASDLPLFGQGPYRCVASRFSVDLLAAAVLAAAHRFGEVQGGTGRLPRRRCRVHLVHPDRPVPVATIAPPTAEAPPAGCPAHRAAAPAAARRPGLPVAPTPSSAARCPHATEGAPR